MTNTIQKLQIIGTFKQRVIVKKFNTSQAMHTFLNAQHNNEWVESKINKAGTYAFVGGEYVNIKKIDKSILAHI